MLTLTIVSYIPSFALAILGGILFLLASILHLWLLVKYRVWYFTPLLVGTVLEVVGYIFRGLSSRQDPYSVVRLAFLDEGRVPR